MGSQPKYYIKITTVQLMRMLDAKFCTGSMFSNYISTIVNRSNLPIEIESEESSKNLVSDLNTLNKFCSYLFKNPTKERLDELKNQYGVKIEEYNKEKAS